MYFKCLFPGLYNSLRKTKIESFRKAPIQAQKDEYDGVEIHGAYGYLF